MNDLFIPYELAVIAKQKGFNEPCLAKYTKGELFWHPVSGSTIENSFLYRSVAAPLYLQILDWVKYKYNIKIIENPNTGGWDIYKSDGFNYHLTKQLGDINEAVEESFKLI